MNNATAQSAARPLGDIAVGAVEEAKQRVGDHIACAQDKAQEFKKIARDTFTNKPVTALAVTLDIGLLLGAVLARR